MNGVFASRTGARHSRDRGNPANVVRHPDSRVRNDLSLWEMHSIVVIDYDVFTMPLNEDQKRALLTNLARDKAENLRAEILKTMKEAKANPPPNLSEEDRKKGEFAMQRALESAQRMLENLEKAMKLAEEMVEDSKADEAEADDGGAEDHRFN